MLVVDRLTKRFGATTVLEDVSVEFPARSVNFIIGPNGAGKTTLLRCLLGLYRHEGSVTWDGAPIDPSDRRVAAVFDDAPAYPSLTGAQNIAVLAPGADRRPTAYLTSEQLGRRVRGYSLGQRMRLALTMAFGCDAELVVLDEPAAGLDREALERLREDLVRMRADTTFLVTGHNLEFYEDVVDAIFVVADGAVRRWQPTTTTSKEGSLVQAYNEHFQTSHC